MVVLSGTDGGQDENDKECGRRNRSHTRIMTEPARFCWVAQCTEESSANRPPGYWHFFVGGAQRTSRDKYLRIASLTRIRPVSDSMPDRFPDRQCRDLSAIPI